MSTSKTAEPSRRDRYHHGNLRQALLDEGITLLEEHGEAGFSLRELARRVGVTPNAAYRHFASKEALLMGLAAAGFRLFGNSQMGAWRQAGGSDANRFLATGSSYVNFARTHPALFRLMFGRFAAAQRSDDLETASNTAFAGLQQGVAAALHLPPEAKATRLAAYHAWALVHGFSHLILDGQIRGTSTEIETLVESALQQRMSVQS